MSGDRHGTVTGTSITVHPVHLSGVDEEAGSKSIRLLCTELTSAYSLRTQLVLFTRKRIVTMLSCIDRLITEYFNKENTTLVL